MAVTNESSRSWHRWGCLLLLLFGCGYVGVEEIPTAVPADAGEDAGPEDALFDDGVPDPIEDGGNDGPAPDPGGPIPDDVGPDAAPDGGDAGPDAGPLVPFGTVAAVTYVSTGQVTVNALAVDESGNIFFGGGFRGAVDFGLGMQTAVGAVDSAFLVSVGRDMAVRWVHTWGSISGFNQVQDIAIGQGNHVYVSGVAQQDITIDGLAVGVTARQQALLASFTNGGAIRGARVFGSGANAQGRAVAASMTDGLVALGGSYDLDFDAGGGPLPSATGPTEHAFVAAFDEAGGTLDYRFQHGVTTTDLASTLGLAFDGPSNTLIAGGRAAGGDLGEGVTPTAGGLDAFVIEFDPDGVIIRSRRFGSTGFDFIWRVAMHPSESDYFVAGQMAPNTNFGDGVILPGFGSSDGFVARYNSEGALRYAVPFGGMDSDRSWGLMATASGAAYVSGTVNGVLNVQGSSFSGPNMPGFILGIAPDGRYSGSVLLGTGGLASIRALAEDVSAERIVAVGIYTGSVEIDGTVYPGGGTGESSFLWVLNRP